MEIKARRWLAVLYKCPHCRSQTARTQLTPTKRHRESTLTCGTWECEGAYQIIERKYYTTFAREDNVSFSTVAGTLEKIGSFDVCQIVHPNIRAFRKWVEKRRIELAEQREAYMKEWEHRKAEGEAQRKKEAAERALFKEVEHVVYQREHAIELQAEQVAHAAWPDDMPNPPSTSFNQEPTIDWLKDHPF
jgi:hypothetical protein